MGADMGAVRIGAVERGKPLTPPPSRRMIEFCDAVKRITAECGRPPSWRELADAMGVDFVTALDLGYFSRKRGLVTWTDGEPYSIRVVGCGGRCHG